MSFLNLLNFWNPAYISNIIVNLQRNNFSHYRYLKSQSVSKWLYEWASLFVNIQTCMETWMQFTSFICTTVISAHCLLEFSCTHTQILRVTLQCIKHLKHCVNTLFFLNDFLKNRPTHFQYLNTLFFFKKNHIF